MPRQFLNGFHAEWTLVLSLAAICLAAPALAQAASPDSVTAWTGPISVDLRESACRAVSPGSVGVSPKWCGVTEAGAYVVLQSVERATTPSPSTNTLATFSADEESSYSYMAGEPCVRLIHRVYSSQGVELAEPLVRDVSFGTKSAAGPAFVADSRAGSLQEAARSDLPVNLAYSTAWATNAAAVAISAVKLSDQGGSPTATNAMFTASANAEGLTQMRKLGSGWWRLLCQVSDGSGDVLLEYLTDEFKMKGGFIMCFR